MAIGVEIPLAMSDKSFAKDNGALLSSGNDENDADE